MQGGVRRRCYNTYICNFTNDLRMNDYVWYICMYVRDTKGMLDVLFYMVMEISDTGYVFSYQYQLNSN